jgi:hypothetical protein
LEARIEELEARIAELSDDTPDLEIFAYKTVGDERERMHLNDPAADWFEIEAGLGYDTTTGIWDRWVLLEGGFNTTKDAWGEVKRLQNDPELCKAAIEKAEAEATAD